MPSAPPSRSRSGRTAWRRWARRRRRRISSGATRTTFERNRGFDHAMPDDPLPDVRSHNRSVLKPYGVWAVITPFNYPLALAGGPVAAALVTGNTVVLKGATDTPWAGRLLADCLRDAGFPPGVFNYLSGPGSVVGEAIINHPDLAGITVTGSVEVGMRIYRLMGAGPWPRPCIAEMGGKNACIVTRHGDLDRAAIGIVRSAFGMGGQKCSALSRVYVESGCRGRPARAHRREDAGAARRRSHAPRELAGPRHLGGGGAQFRALLRRAADRRRTHPRGRSRGCRTAIWRTGTSWRPRWRKRRTIIPSSRRRCSSPSSW